MPSKKRKSVPHRGGTRKRPDKKEQESQKRLEKLREAEEQARQAEERRKEALAKIKGDDIPNLNDYVAKTSGIPIRAVRSYVRETMVPELLLRMYDTATGIQTFDVPTQFGGIVNVPAGPNLQMKTAQALVELGVPKPRGTEGEGVPFSGVLVLGELGLAEARETARLQRAHALDLDPSRQIMAGYQPPAGHEVVVIEDDLSGAAKPTDPDAAPAPLGEPAMTKAREIAARRRAEKQRRAG